MSVRPAIGRILAKLPVRKVYVIPEEAIQDTPVAVILTAQSTSVRVGYLLWETKAQVKLWVVVDKRTNLLDALGVTAPWLETVKHLFLKNDLLYEEGILFGEITEVRVGEAIREYNSKMWAVIEVDLRIRIDDTVQISCEE